MTETNHTTFDTTGLDTVKLRAGCGSGDEGDCCAWQDIRRRLKLPSKSYECPDTASNVLHAMTVPLNDASDVWRAGLVQFEERLAFSVASPEVEERRIFRIVDWSLCEMLPLAIDSTVELCDGDSGQTRELSRLAMELRAQKGADLAALAARADLADLAALAARADRADLAALAALADLAARAARADLAARADRADLAALADRAARAARADLAALAALADLAEADRKIWPSIEALLNELLAMKDTPDAAAAQADQ